MKRTPVLPLALLLLFTVAGARAQVLMSGDVYYVSQGSRISIFAEEITNVGAETTDRLRFRLWASKHHHWSQYNRGHLIAFTLLPRLFPYEVWHDVHPRIGLHRPSNGWYYVTLTLEERVVDARGTHWEFRDVIAFDGQTYFRRDFVGWPFPF
jgi:hypothetical protein